VSGKLQVRDTVLNAGDYVYEPSGVLHEDATYIFICDGSVLYFDDDSFTGYLNWEMIEEMHGAATALKAAE
jgi:hypothetical protein